MKQRPLIAIIVMTFISLDVFATTTSNEGALYRQECLDAGVPVPETWDTSSEEWEFYGTVNIKEKLNPGSPIPTLIFPGTQTDAYVYRSTSPRGLCMALPRLTPGTNIASTLGLICQGSRTSKACFFEIPVRDDGASEGPVDINNAVPMAAFASGHRLEFHRNGVCSDCHSGDNIFVVHPNTAIQFKPNSMNVEELLVADNWVDPIVHTSWPQNPGPLKRLVFGDVGGDPGMDISSQLSACTGCHNLPIPSRGLGDYCNQVLTRAIRYTMPTPAPGALDGSEVAAALREDCMNNNPKPRILFPTQNNKENAGDETDPGKIWVQVEPPLRRIYDPSQYTITIGGEPATIISGSEVNRQMWLVVEPSARLSAGLHDLVVSVEDPGYPGTPGDPEDPPVPPIPMDPAIEVDAVQLFDASVPVDLMIVGDVSGSMNDFGKLAAAQSAARLYVNHASDGDQIGIVRFSSTAQRQMDLTEVLPGSDPRSAAIRIINDWTAGGQTAMGLGMREAVNEFNRNGEVGRTWRMALLSDDLENVEPKWSNPDDVIRNEVVNNAKNKINVDMVSLGADAATNLAQDVAASTMGRYFSVVPSTPPLVSSTKTTAGQFVPVAVIDPLTSSLPNRLAGVYKSMAEGARKEQRIGDWDGALTLDTDQSDEFELTLESGLPEVIIAVHWDNSLADIRLAINDYSCAEFGGEIKVDSTHVQCRIDNPAPGPITIKVVWLRDIIIISDKQEQSTQQGRFVTVSEGSATVNYKLMVSAYSNTAAMTAPLSNTLKQGERKPYVVFVGDDNIINGAIVWLQIIDSLGIATLIQLFDDGLHGDGSAGDGFYGNFIQLNAAGHYRVNTTVTATDNNTVPFKRTTTDTIFVEDRIFVPAQMLAAESLMVSDRSQVVTDPEGDIFVGQSFELGADAEMLANMFVNGDVTLRSRAKIDGDLTLLRNLNRQDGTTVTGAINRGVASVIPSLPVLSFAVGTENLTVPNDQEATWEPGAYGDATVRARGTLYLKKGKYFFRSLNFEPDSEIFLLNSLDDTEIYVENNLNFGSRMSFRGRTKHLRIYSNSQSTVNLGPDLSFSGTLVVPRGEVQVFSRTSSLTIGAKRIRVEPDSLLNP